MDRSIRWAVAWAGVALCVGSSGCVRYATALQHPMASGQVERNELIERDADQERNLALEKGTLQDSVSLVHLDAENACFAVVFRDVNYSPLKQIARRTYSLHVADAKPLPVTDEQPYPTQTRQVDSLVQRTQLTGYQTSCAYSDCSTVNHTPVYERDFVPGTNRISVGGAQLCFRHGGQISTDTDKLVLKERLPREGRDDVIRWVWKLESSSAAMAPTGR